MLKTISKNIKIKYTLGGKNFRTWDEVRVNARQILSKGKRRLKGKNLKFAIDLLSYHPFFEEKTRDGVKFIKVGDSTFGSGICFIIVDNNSNEQDFSHYNCTPTAKKDKEKAIASIKTKTRLKCYREAIQNDILDFSNAHCSANMKCSGCKVRFKEIKTNNDIQIDHKTKSFVTLVTEFEAFYKPQKYPAIERTKSIQSVKFNTDSIDDMEFVSLWQKYHKDNADFQFLCAGCNIRKQDGSRYKPYIN